MLSICEEILSEQMRREAAQVLIFVQIERIALLVNDDDALHLELLKLRLFHFL